MNSVKKDRLSRATPESLGIPSAAILAFVDAVERQGIELHGFQILRHGRVAAEGSWAPYAPERPHMLFSLSKSFTSAAVGFAAAEGRLSVDDPVLSFFRDRAPAETSGNLEDMRVRHLLSMSTGHAKDTTHGLGRKRDGDWVKAFLSLPVRYRPGTHFVYNSGATYMLSAIVQKVTGQRLVDYLQPRLFRPLGIRNPTWEQSPNGVDCGGWGLSIAVKDIAAFGQLLLSKGVWKGRRVLPRVWVEEATSIHIANDKMEKPDWRVGYGWQFWRCRHGAYRGDGAFGQYCIVMPEQDAVLAVTGGVKDMQAPLDLVWDLLLPRMAPAPLPASPRTRERLRKRLAGLSYDAPVSKWTPKAAARISGKTYRMEPNRRGIRGIRLDFSRDSCTLVLRDRRGGHAVECGIGSWRSGLTTLMDRPGAEAVTAAGAWTGENRFVVSMRFLETPFRFTLDFRFRGKSLRLRESVNVSFGPTEFPPLSGKEVSAP